MSVHSPLPPPIANPFDHASRSPLKRGGVALLCWLLKIAPKELRFVRWLDTRLTLPDQPERVCDTIAHVQRLDQGGYPWATLVEFQSKPDSRMFGRVLVYEGMLWLQEKPIEEAGDRFHLQSVVINLTGVGRTACVMPWLPGAGTAVEPIEWDLETLDAEVILDKVERGEAPPTLLAWVSLMKKGNDPGTIERWLKVADQERDPIRKADLALVVVYAQLTGHERTWQKALEGFNVVESVIVNEWKAEAAVKTRIADILRFLEARFGPVSPETRAKIEATDSVAVLENWVTLAGKVASLEEFRQTTGI